MKDIDIKAGFNEKILATLAKVPMTSEDKLCSNITYEMAFKTDVH